MVRQNGTVYTVDTTGKVRKYLKQMLEKKNSVSQDEKEQVVEKLKVFSEGYTDNNFSLLYETQNDISSTLLAYTDTMLAQNKEELAQKYGQSAYITAASPKEGLVSFLSDGMEKLEQAKVSKNIFVNKVKMKDLRTDKNKKQGKPVYQSCRGTGLAAKSC